MKIARNGRQEFSPQRIKAMAWAVEKLWFVCEYLDGFSPFMERRMARPDYSTPGVRPFRGAASGHESP